MRVSAPSAFRRFAQLAFWSTIASAFFTSAIMAVVAAVVEIRGEDVGLWEAAAVLPYQVFALFMPAISVAVTAWPYTLTCAAAAFLLARLAGSGRLAPHRADRLAAVFAGAVSAVAFCLLPVLASRPNGAVLWSPEVLGGAFMSFTVIFPFVFPAVMLATALAAWSIYKPEALAAGPAP